MVDEKFGKKYKLCSRKIIDSIFEKGKQEKAFPFFLRYVYTSLNTDTNFQVVISVPKRKFKRATDRNRIKRLVREAVRKNKYILEEKLFAPDQKLALFLIYTSTKEESYQKIFDKIEALFLRLVKEET